MYLMLMLAGAAAMLAAPQSNEDILATFELHPDFQIELIAREPVVFDPVDMVFDEAGRLYVLEMPGYPLGETSGHVIQLKDANGDGFYEERMIFADNFPVADSLLPWKGGLLVASPPDLVFIKDTDGDGRADVREILLSGFDVGNTQHNFNGLTYGLDNWIYAASGGNAGAVHWPHTPEEKTPIRGNDFRFDLNAKRFEVVGASTGGFELALDDFGRFFATHNMVHASQLVFPGPYLAHVAGLSTNTLHNISDHEESGTARVFPIGEQETRVNHPDQSGYFSGSCGITMYNGGAFGDAFQGNLFVCDVVVNIVHRDVLTPNGTTFTASRDRERVEFLASTDRAFRPVNAYVGPDGALYILDMHRTVIEHPEWIPDEIEVNLDISAGMDKGRIFRITPKGGLPRPEVSFPRENPAVVAAALGHANKWWRDTAQRLLVEWQDKSVVPALENALQEGRTPQERLHAMWTLAGLDALPEALLLAALSDADPGVRENAILIAEHHLESEAVRESVHALAAAAGTEAARVRLRAVLALSTLPAEAEDVPSRLEALRETLHQDLADPFSRRAVLAAAARDPQPMLIRLLDDATLRSAPQVLEVFQKLAEFAARSGGAEDTGAILGAIAAVNTPAISEAVLSGLVTGVTARSTAPLDWAQLPTLRTPLETMLQEAPMAVVREAWRLGNALGLAPGERQQALMQEARDIALDASAPVNVRLDALALLELAPYPDRLELLFGLLHSRHPREVQTAAITQITEGATPEVADRLIAEWKTLSAPVRVSTGNMLLRRRDNHDRLLTALETGAIGLGEMNFTLERRRMLLWWSDNDEVKRRAEKLFTDAGVVTREAALEAMRPALALEGDVNAGITVFAENCAKCHMISGAGHNVGPDLTDIFRKSRETLLHDILDPNAAVDPQYISFTIETQAADVFDQQIITGMIVEENESAITLREAGGINHTIPRASIASMTSTGLSMMPEELEAGLTPQLMADLLAFLLEPR